MKVLFVGSGAIPIPPPGWGGAENIIHQQRTFLEAAGHFVGILNERHRAVLNGLRARPWRYDLVHLHHDARARVWVRLSTFLRFPLAITTHYGYAAFPQRWAPRYHRTFQEMLKAPNLICLSPQIRDLCVERGYRGHSFVLPNGIHTAEIRWQAQAALPRTIVLGRIEPRKRQAWIAQRLQGAAVACDLVGPSEDPAFAGNGVNVRYHGPWTRRQVEKELTDYAAMALLSDGEAHAGVLLEALAAGLSLVVTPEASHNFDTSLPFIHLFDPACDDLAAVLERAVAENPGQRAAARRYAEEEFDWKTIGPRYLAIADDVRRQAGPGVLPRRERNR